uniref:Kinesin motor domain-containing protein n=1 Tax=Gouania willdenowi TaxID=441366 RepID=A0A8C5EBY2_GOUWI
MNKESSRSHTILTLHIRSCCHNNANSSGFSSKLRLVDLAGSERVSLTGNNGTKLKESAHINKSLLALGNVMRALSGRHGNKGSSAHVPYRNSKITHLLRDCLGGTAHTLMVACISPSHHKNRSSAPPPCQIVDSVSTSSVRSCLPSTPEPAWSQPHGLLSELPALPASLSAHRPALDPLFSPRTSLPLSALIRTLHLQLTKKYWK